MSTIQRIVPKYFNLGGTVKTRTWTADDTTKPLLNSRQENRRSHCCALRVKRIKDRFFGGLCACGVRFFWFFLDSGLKGVLWVFKIIAFWEIFKWNSKKLQIDSLCVSGFTWMKLQLYPLQSFTRFSFFCSLKKKKILLQLFFYVLVMRLSFVYAAVFCLGLTHF